ncbi:hypothetical protein GCM10011360_13440 [Primorskyibacter flagellatus]|uniref:DUF2239 domain-containing protein n=1 Tax=Primorskyibacter flagellatus TaxID=1387277 RepID=A0A917A5J2_9RHOB|nr:DUF2239 family protein [Primorskyibacter flagellatus]GGE26374.1 hypothetical protein GCM10011360_13440 [Primorskyibacter flagellatus]
MSETFSAFAVSSFPRIVARGTRAEIAHALLAQADPQVLIFSDETGRETDLDLSGGAEAVAARYDEAPRRGRPRLGVTAREVTLLPRHWDWLATQRGGASATLRRLVEAASKGDDAPRRRDACYRFCSALAGNLPGFEEAMRALYAGDPAAFRAHAARWPEDLRAHALSLWSPE